MVVASAAFHFCELDPHQHVAENNSGPISEKTGTNFHVRVRNILFGRFLSTKGSDQVTKALLLHKKYALIVTKT